jgi:hypothetical protein
MVFTFAVCAQTLMIYYENHEDIRQTKKQVKNLRYTVIFDNDLFPTSWLKFKFQS